MGGFFFWHARNVRLVSGTGLRKGGNGMVRWGFERCLRRISVVVLGDWGGGGKEGCLEVVFAGFFLRERLMALFG